MGNQLTELYLALLDFVEPLRRRLTGPEALEYLFYRYGWNAAMDDAAFARIQQVAGVITPLNNFIQVAEPLRQQLEANPDAQLGAADALALTQAAVSLIRALAEFKLSDLSGLADPFGRADFWEDVAEHIFDDLLEEYMRIYHRQFFAVLRLWNVIRYDMTTPSVPARTTYTRTTFDWEQALAMVETPLEALQHAYHWGDATHAFEHQAALDALQQMLGAIGVPAKRFAPKMRSKAPFPSETGRAIRDDLSALRAIVLDNYSSIDRILYKLGFEIFPAARTGEPQP